MIEHGKIAEDLFRQGYNCAQSVLLAFSDITGLDDTTAAMLASSFGGGLSRMREVCGAVSGAAMVLGIVKGYSDPTDHHAKKAHYHLVQEFARRFKERNGSIVCRELLAGADASVGGDPAERTEAYYKKRPCPKLVRIAAEITDDLLNSP
ncbi:MAG: C_GCAxxG_C_C family protein [Ruminococcus sp.]|nr:C_GCAxxG_C_C family protein [Ruminococcus sp.]